MTQSRRSISVEILNVKVLLQRSYCNGLDSACYDFLFQVSEEDLSDNFASRLRDRLSPADADRVITRLLRNMILDAETLRLVGRNDFLGDEV